MKKPKRKPDRLINHKSRTIGHIAVGYNQCYNELEKYYKEEIDKLQSQIETLEEYNRSKEKYIETLQKHYNEIYTENTKLLSKIKVMNEIIEDLTLGAEAFKRQKEDEIKDLKEEIKTLKGIIL